MKSKRIEEHFSNTKQHKKIEEKNKKTHKIIIEEKKFIEISHTSMNIYERADEENYIQKITHTHTYTYIKLHMSTWKEGRIQVAPLNLVGWQNQSS